MMKRRTVLLAGVAVPVTLMAGCGGGDAVGTRVRLVNASRAYSPLDLWIEDDREISNVAYGQASDYENVDSGGSDVALTRTDQSTELIEERLDIESQEPQTFLAYGAEGAVQIALLAEGRDENDVDDDEAWIRVFNAAPDAGALDLYLTAAGEDVDLDDATADITDAAYGEPTETFQVDSGIYQLRLTEAGDKDEVRLDVASFELREGRIYTLVVTPSAGGVMVDALLLPQDDDIVVAANTLARVRVVAGVGTADVVVRNGDGDIVADLASPAVDRYRPVTAGTLSLTVTVDGADVALDAIDVEAGADITLLVHGPAGAPRVSVVVDDNSLPTPADDQAAVRLVNVVDGSGTLSMTVAGEPVANGVDAGEASANVEIDARTDATIRVRPSEGSVWESDEDLVAGAVYSVFVFGTDTDIEAELIKDR